MVPVDRRVRAALLRLIAQEGGQNAAARRLGVTKSYLSDLLKNRRRPGPKILEPLGFREVVERHIEEVAP